MNNFNVYFPIKNLNHQGWLTDFFTPYIKKTSNQRSVEANLLYDKEFLKNSQELLKKKFTNQSELNDFLRRRSSEEDEKIISLNANFLDKIETNQSYFESSLTQEEYQKYIRFMSSAKPYELAFLQNYMRLSYGFKKDPAQVDYEFVDFPFTQIFDKDFILGENKSGFPRTEGSGIKSISVSNDFNLVTHVNSKVTINLFFGSMKILSREMKSNGAVAENEQTNKQQFPFGFNFMKLFTSFDISREIIKLEYGKKVSDGFNQYVSDPQLKDIIEKKERKILYLNKINHNFTFNADGRIGLSVTYLDLGRAKLFRPNTVYIPYDESKIEGFTEYKTLLRKFHEQKKLADEKQREILVRETELQQSGKVEALKELKEKNKTTLSEINRVLDDRRQELRNNFPTIFLDKIKQQGKLFSFNFKTDKNNKQIKIISYLNLVKPTDGSFLNLFEYEKTYDLATLQTTQTTENLFSRIFNVPGNVNKKDKNKSFGYFNFFALKSLISSAYSFLSEEEKRDVPYLLLGNVYTTINNKSASINIGDLLVEAETFRTWYYENCLSKDRKEYSFGAFISDIVNDLVPRILYRNSLINTNSPSSILFKNFYISEDLDEDLKRKIYFNSSEEDLNQFTSKISSNISKSNPNALIYITQVNSISSNLQSPSINNKLSEYTFDEIKDNKKGILHIKFGADGGIIKNASFSATDNSKIRTAYAYESLTNSVSKALLYYYQMSLDMLGNNTFSYNSFVCVPLKALGLQSVENDPGISGYYKVISTSDEIGQDLSYNTSANCVWVFSPASDKNTNFDKNQMSDNNKIQDYLETDVNDPIKYINQLVSESVDAQANNGAPVKPPVEKSPDQNTKK